MKAEWPSYKVSKKDGSIRISTCELVICDRLLIEDAKLHLQRFIRSATDYKNGYEWLYLGSLNFGDMPAGLSLCFFNGELWMATFSVGLPDDEDFDNWPTEETSMRQVAFMRKVLEKQLSCSMKIGHHEFAWGSAWSNFDIKGYQASGGLRYART